MNCARLVEVWSRGCLRLHEWLSPIMTWLLNQARRGVSLSVQPDDLVTRMRRSDGVDWRDREGR